MRRLVRVPQACCRASRARCQPMRRVTASILQLTTPSRTSMRTASSSRTLVPPIVTLKSVACSFVFFITYKLNLSSLIFFVYCETYSLIQRRTISTMRVVDRRMRFAIVAMQARCITYSMAVGSGRFRSTTTRSASVSCSTASSILTMHPSIKSVFDHFLASFYLFDLTFTLFFLGRRVLVIHQSISDSQSSSRWSETESKLCFEFLIVTPHIFFLVFFSDKSCVVVEFSCEQKRC